MEKIFLDTNILVYILDKSDRKKRELSRSTITALNQTNSIVISTQVIQEFYFACVKKYSYHSIFIKEVIKDFLRWEVIQISPDLIMDAIDISALHKFSFWNSLILSASLFGGCKQIISEDFQDGQRFRGVKIVNPFNSKSKKY